MAVGKSLAQKSIIFRRMRSVAAWYILLHLRFFARIALSQTHARCVGIAGSVGKSTARNALAAILPPEETHVVSGNSETGIPLGLLKLSPGTYSLTDWIRIMVLAPLRIFSLKAIRYLVVEMGIDGPNPPKNMAYLLTIVKPDIAILLNETPAHVGNYEPYITHMRNLQPTTHASAVALAKEDYLQPTTHVSAVALAKEDNLQPTTHVSAVALAKEDNLQPTTYNLQLLDTILSYMTLDDGKIITDSGCSTAIVNADDPYIRKHILSRTTHPYDLRLFGSNQKQHTTSSSYMSYSSYSVNLKGTNFRFMIGKKVLSLAISGSVLPRDTQSVFAAVLLAADTLGITPQDAIRRIEQNLTIPPGRAGVFQAIRNSTVIDSSYNASSASVIAYLELLKTLKKSHKGPVAFLFGDMLELGNLSELEHTKVAKHMSGIVDELYLVGPITRSLTHIFTPFVPFVLSFHKSTEAGMYLKKHLKTNTLLLVKGSQFLEEAIKLILRNPEDKEALCRQDAYWQNQKKQKNLWVYLS